MSDIVTDVADWPGYVRSLDRVLSNQRALVESVKGICIGLERGQREQRRGGIDVAGAIVRSLVCRLKSYNRAGVTAEEICEQLYGQKGHGYTHTLRALNNLPALVQRAAVSPAQTTVATWAAELAGTDNFPGLLPSLAPTSVYAQLSGRGLRVTLAPNASIKLPARLATPTLAGDFILEGAPIPARRLSLTATATITPHKMAVLSHFSLELGERSAPVVEAVIRQAISDDTSNVLDSRLLDNAAGSATRPAGLLAGITPIGATAITGGSLAALSTDLGNLVAAISAPVDPVLIMSPSDQIRATTIAPGLLTVPIISAPGLTARQVICVDASDFASAEGDAPRLDMSEGATIHEEDTAPLAIGTVGSPATVAAPTRSLYQTDAVAVRLIQFVTWVLRRPNRVSTIASVTW